MLDDHTNHEYTKYLKLLTIAPSSLQYSDNSVIQRALPGSLTLSVLPILRGSCFQVVLTKPSFLSHISHLFLYVDQPAHGIEGQAVVHACTSWSSVKNTHVYLS